MLIIIDQVGKRLLKFKRHPFYLSKRISFSRSKKWYSLCSASNSIGFSFCQLDNFRKLIRSYQTHY
jgi:hypothetical protein